MLLQDCLYYSSNLSVYSFASIELLKLLWFHDTMSCNQYLLNKYYLGLKRNTQKVGLYLCPLEDKKEAASQ